MIMSMNYICMVSSFVSKAHHAKDAAHLLALNAYAVKILKEFKCPLSNVLIGAFLFGGA